METSVITKKVRSKSGKKNNMVTVRISVETKKIIFSLLQKINKKDFGRKIRSDALLAKAMSLIEQKHIEELQEKTMTNADRLERKFQQYISKNCVITKDEFIGKLINGELDLNEQKDKITG